MTLGRAALEARDLVAARAAIGPLIALDATNRPTARTCLLMADIETADGAEGAAREWLARAARAPRDKAWIADGIICDRWAPASPTGALDAFVWRAPEERLSAPPPAAAPPAPAPTPLAAPAPTPLATPAPAPLAAPAPPPAPLQPRSVAPPAAANAPRPPVKAMIVPTVAPDDPARSATTRPRPNSAASPPTGTGARTPCPPDHLRSAGPFPIERQPDRRRHLCVLRSRGGLPVAPSPLSVSVNPPRRGGGDARQLVGNVPGITATSFATGGGAMADAYYYVDDAGQQQGPIAVDDILALVRRGTVRAETLSWTAGMSDWARAKAVPAFASAFAAAPRHSVRARRRCASTPVGPLTGAFPAWGLFWRSVVLALGIIFVLPAPWAGVWFYKWFAGKVVLPGGRPLRLEAQVGGVWWLFLGLGVMQWVGPTLDVALDVRWGGALSSIFGLIFGWRLSAGSAATSKPRTARPGSPLPADILPYIGWSLLVGVSFVTIIGWAWAFKYFLHWICARIEGVPRFAFNGGGFAILWRGVVFTCVRCCHSDPVAAQVVRQLDHLAVLRRADGVALNGAEIEVGKGARGGDRAWPNGAARRPPRPAPDGVPGARARPCQALGMCL